MDRTFPFIVSGVLLALACQWVCNLLSIATGIFSPGTGDRRKHLRYYQAAPPGEDAADGAKAYRQDAPKLKISAGTGLLALGITVASVFIACRFASELHRIGTRSEALVLGLTVWAGFLAASYWSAARSPWTMSVLGYLFGVLREGSLAAAADAGPMAQAAATSPVAHEGGGAMPGGTPSRALPVIGSDTGWDSAESSAADSAEGVAAKVRREFRDRNGLDFRDRLRGYLDRLHPKSPDRSEIEGEADRLFAEPEFLESAREGSLQPRDRNRFREILAGRADIAAQENEQWVDAIHSRWNRLVESGQGKGAAPARSEALRATAPQSNTKDTLAQGTSPGSYSLSGASGDPAPGAQEASTAENTSSEVTARLQGFKEFLGAADRRELNPARIEDEVEILVVHPEEGFAAMERTIRELKREEMVKILRQRRDISRQEADSIADLIDSARARMLSRAEIREHRSQEATDRALARIRDHVYSLKRPDMDYQGFQQDLARMLAESTEGSDAAAAQLPEIRREIILAEIAARKEFSRADAEKLADTVEKAVGTVRENILRMEQETARRLDAHRRASTERMESARRDAAAAAWWLFGIALTSAAASALGAWEGPRP